MQEKKFKRYVIEIEPEEYEPLIGSLYEALPDVGFIVNENAGKMSFEFYLPEDIEVPFEIVSKWNVEQVGYDNQEWLNSLRGKFRGTSVRGIKIVPPWQSHETGELVIYPGMAFGTGEHPSTKLALGLMTFCPFGGKTFLDIGTGSGILAIYAKKQGAKYVLGIDIDPISIENAVDNARLNEVEVEYRVADAFEISGSFDIVCANLVTDLLINLKDRLLSLCNEFLIMSGVPFEDYDKIERAFGTPTMAMFGEGWVSFLFRHA